MPFKNTTLAEYARLGEKEVLKELETHLDGLSNREAEKRLSLYGLNQIAEKKELNIVLEFLTHFKSPLILILLIAAIVSAIFGAVVDATIIGVIIILSVALDFFLEHNAEKASEKLKEGVQTKTVVIRDERQIETNYVNLCEGDIIFLNAGNLVPADARVLIAKDFFVNQSALTGESFPVEKASELASSSKLSISDMKNIVFMGTNVVTGSATAVVVKTGKNTEFGKIASQLNARPEETEFERGIGKFGALITKAILFLVLFIFLFNSIVKHDVLQSFIFAIAVAVGLTPELLPMIMSVTMAKGSLSMAKKGVIVKKLSSISNFGSMDVLCTDKTGTLTEDKIKLVKYTDVFGKTSENALVSAYLTSSYQTGIKNPLDNALLKFKKIKISDYKKIDEIPFDFIRKKMSVVVEKSKKLSLITKGAPEEIFKSSEYYSYNGRQLRLTKDAFGKIEKQYHELSRQGYRVLAVAKRNVKYQRAYNKAFEAEMTLLGFVSFLDPPKKDVKRVIKELNNIGIDIKIITGDNELVTKKICSDLGIRIKGILLGSEIDTLTDDALKVKVEQANIFARFSPDEKNRIIHALKANGHVVGYMGDGINDAPSLKSADVGISVNTAVDVAKESAAIILTQKSLDVLKDGVLDGRKTFGNTMKYIMMGLSSNFGNMFSVAGAVIFLPFLPMLPIQILLNNFIYDFSQITIPSDNTDEEYIKKPKRWDIGFIKKFMFTLGPVSSLFDFVTFFVMFSLFGFSTIALQSNFQTAWFMESLATQTLVIFIIRTRKTPFLQSRPSIWLFISSIACVALGWLIPYSPAGKWFGLVPLPWHVVLPILGIVFVYLLIVEIVKRIFYQIDLDFH